MQPFCLVCFDTFGTSAIRCKDHNLQHQLVAEDMRPVTLAESDCQRESPDLGRDPEDALTSQLAEAPG